MTKCSSGNCVAIVLFMGIPTQVAAADQRKPSVSAAFQPTYSVAQFVSEVRSFWRKAVTFGVDVADMLLHQACLPVVLKKRGPGHSIKTFVSPEHFDKALVSSRAFKKASPSRIMGILPGVAS
jgi:hypothetical protein